MVIRRCRNEEFDEVWTIVNDGAQAYRGIIPEDCWSEPYMTHEKLRAEIGAGVEFWGCEERDRLAGVMGIQRVQDVTLIRHAYVRSASQRRGIGALLLAHLRASATTPVLIGTWADAQWAIDFYRKHGFEAVPSAQKSHLLKQYWSVPERQIETSVVLADAAWRAR